MGKIDYVISTYEKQFWAVDNTTTTVAFFRLYWICEWIIVPWPKMHGCNYIVYKALKGSQSSYDKPVRCKRDCIYNRENWLHCQHTLDRIYRTHILLIIPPLQRSVYWFHLVRPSVRLSVLLYVCGQNRVRYPSDQFHIYTSYQPTSANASSISFLISNICIFDNFFKFKTLTLFCVHLVWMFKLNPDLIFFCKYS